MPDTHVSTIIREYTTVAAILIGGCWALWRWGFEEWLRRKRDFPALDGELKTAEVSIGAGKIVVTVNAIWRNRGKLPVDLDPARTFVKVYSLHEDILAGPFDDRSKGLKLSFDARPLRGWTGYTLEPSTESLIQQCFVLPENNACLFHFGVCICAKQDAYSYLKSEMWCERYLVWRPTALAAKDSFR